MADVDLKELRKQCMESLYLCTDNVLKYLENEKDAELDKLKNCVRNYCLMEARQALQEEALVKVVRETDISNLNSLDHRFKAEFERRLEQNRPNVDNHHFMINFQKKVAHGQATASQNLNDSDIAITETQEAYLDPFTLKRIRDPVRNKFCKHLYERSSMHAHIKRNGRAKCPVVGCINSHPLAIEDLEEYDSAQLGVAGPSRIDRSVLDLHSQ